MDLNLCPAKVLDSLPPALVHGKVIDLTKLWQGKHHYVTPEGQYNFMYESARDGLRRCLSTRL